MVPARYVLVLLLWLGFMLSYHLRTVLSVTVEDISSELNWDNQQRGFVLSAFFLGYIVFQVPGGWLATSLGGKVILGVGVVLPCILTACIPLVVPSYAGVVALRILSGVFQGAVYPSAHALLGKWALPSEHSRFVGIVWSGSFLGTALTFPAAAAIMGPETLPNWRAVFYVVGAIGSVWGICWALLAFNKPETHPWISSTELLLLRPGHTAQTEKRKAPNIPWKLFFSSSSVWALVMNHTTHNWGWYLMLTWLPSFIRMQFGSTMDSTSSLMSMSIFPFLACFGMSVASGPLSEYFIQRRKWTIRQVRLLMQSVGELVPAVVFLVVGYSTSLALSVSLLTVAVGATGFSSSGYGSNHLDIAPDHAGVLMGLSNCAATIPGILAPSITGTMIGNAEHPSLEDWRTVFNTAAAVYILGVAVWWKWMKACSLPSVHGYTAIPEKSMEA